MHELVSRALTADPTVDITTTGARSGMPRRIEIWMLDVDGRYFITGTPGPRDWMANLQADARLTVHLKRSAHTDLPATARLVTDDALRRWVFVHPSAWWYLTQTPLEELVASAPMIEVIIDDSL